MDGRSTHAR